MVGGVFVVNWEESNRQNRAIGNWKLFGKKSGWEKNRVHKCPYFGAHIIYLIPTFQNHGESVIGVDYYAKLSMEIGNFLEKKSGWGGIECTSALLVLT